MADENFLFPYENVRDEQKRLIEDVTEAINSGKSLLVHAPTGLGKTVAVMGPAIKNAIEKERTVFFLTSRHTQHILAIKTIKDIMKKFEIKVNCCDIIGKKWMCSQAGAESMPSSEFSEYCKALREEGICEYYNNTKNKGKLSAKGEVAMGRIKAVMPVDTEALNEICREEKLCPYEMAALLARDAQVVVADYNYVFNEKIREGFFLRAGKKIEDCIIIVDEGHNLPNRCREMLSERLSSYVLSRALKEAVKFGYDEVQRRLDSITHVLNELSNEIEAEKDEAYVLRKEFSEKVDKLIGYDDSKDLFEITGEEIRDKQRASFIGSVARFMDIWQGPDKGYSRVINVKESRYGRIVSLSYRCLDPSFVTKDVVNNCVSCILMSGTLTPVEMYGDVLGFKNYGMKEYKDIFSSKNRLNLIIEEVTTKYSVRNEEQYRMISRILADIINAVPGNSFVFFPSYELRNLVNRHFERASRKTVFLELPGMSKEEKKEFLEKFKSYERSGAVMMGVAQGSFGEGVDLPGELLKCVVIVGVPLQRPDLITRDLIEYYDEKYGEGMNYGYIYPAITKTLQNAGRCIRSESDRGVIVFMDKRYSWQNYAKCFPAEMVMKVTKMWKERVEGFFGK